jgi:hypothetical protein
VDRNQATAYGEAAPGRCYHCKDKLARVSSGPNRGKFAFVRLVDEIGNKVVAHVSCHDRQQSRRYTVALPDDAAEIVRGGSELDRLTGGYVTPRRRGAE